VIRSQAVFVAIGINTDGYRQILGVDLAGRESQTSWREFLASLRERGLHGVEFVVSDAHEGLRRSLMEMLPEAAWQRSSVHYGRERGVPVCHPRRRERALASRPPRLLRGQPPAIAARVLLECRRQGRHSRRKI